ncbi:AAA family ATPase [Baaleninema simplex]|uniref:AAA family ATPase n=1 Tax=Baaleninema simplex TaxID=2862350 RepID=UPI00034B8BE7|nr:ATP-binding protein [Baaleninema simplex]
MLVRLKLENLYSFKAIEFSAIASRERIHPHHVYPARNRNDVRLTRFAAIYGANASGKSNFVKALEFARNFILHGQRPGEKIPVERFRLDSDCLKRPARFTIEIKSRGVLYEYGFECDRERVHREWLYSFTRQSDRLLFDRQTQANGNATLKFGDFTKSLSSEDRQFLEFVGKGTRPNQLYLHECVEHNLEIFIDPYRWFRHTLTIINPESHPLSIELDLQKDENFQTFFNEILQIADTGISRIETEEVDWDTPEGQLVQNILKNRSNSEFADVIYLHGSYGMRFTVVNHREDSKLLKLVTIHRDSQNREVRFDIYEESDGTKRLLDLIPLLHELIASDGERVFVVDELARSLHPQLSRLLAELHLKSNNQNKPTQLIVTTHETNLLDLELLRRDEVWFMEKQLNGATDLYSLYDFKPRYEKDVLNNYLQGRYGAIPFLGNARALGLTKSS